MEFYVLLIPFHLDFEVITEQYARNAAMYIHFVVKWNTEIVIILLKTMHMLKIIRIQTFILYDSL